jgi:photosystem I P700 chlorophyll a apoprotein A1
MYFHGARFSNYEAWLSDPTHIKPSAQVVWPVVGQEILNGDVGGGFQGIQITSGFFQLWRASGITSELQLYTTAIGGLILAGAMFFAGWFHYHKAAPKLEWFQNVESMLNHHLAGLLGLGSLAWAGHQIHVSLPVNKLLDAGVDPKEIPLPHELLLNRSIISDLYPSFAKGLAPFFTLNWSEYSDFLTFKGGLNPVTGGLWLSDTAHHHVAIAVLFLVAGHMYRTNWGIGHSMKEILEAHKGPFTGEGHVGLYEILTTSWHAQLAINLALFGSLSIIVAFYWVTLNPTICWNFPLVLVETYTQVLKNLFLKKALTPLYFLYRPHRGAFFLRNLICFLWKNLRVRNNQQETFSVKKNTQKGSSETLRRTFFLKLRNKQKKFKGLNDYDFSDYLKLNYSRKTQKANTRLF